MGRAAERFLKSVRLLRGMFPHAIVAVDGTRNVAILMLDEMSFTVGPDGGIRVEVSADSVAAHRAGESC
jgi:hypothetical protein